MLLKWIKNSECTKNSFNITTRTTSLSNSLSKSNISRSDTSYPTTKFMMMAQVPTGLSSFIVSTEPSLCIFTQSITESTSQQTQHQQSTTRVYSQEDQPAVNRTQTPAFLAWTPPHTMFTKQRCIQQAVVTEQHCYQQPHSQTERTTVHLQCNEDNHMHKEMVKRTDVMS